MNTADAWLLPLSAEVVVAVGLHELRYVLPDTPALFEIPRTPDYCCRVLLWQEHIVPLMDLASRFGIIPDANALQSSTVVKPIAIVAYRSEETAAVEHGALLLHGLPWRCSITDEQALELPDALGAWRAYTQACIRLEQDPQAVPVLSLNRLFARRRE